MSQIFKSGTGGGGGGGIVTIDGNSGSVTGTTVTLETANTTVKFVGSGTTMVQDFGLSNLIIGSNAAGSGGGAGENVGLGQGALNALTAGVENVAIGFNAANIMTVGNSNTIVGNAAMVSAVSGESNVAIGTSALNSLNGGDANVVIGASAGFALTNSIGNVAVGSASLSAYTSGAASSGSNTAIGDSTMIHLLTGIDNIAIGSAAGNNYTGAESNNILLGSPGDVGISNQMKLGQTGSISTTFVAGIAGVTAVGSPVAVNAGTGQLSDLGFGTAGNVLTSNGPGVSPTWQAGGGGFTPVNWSVSLSTNQTGVTGDNVSPEYKIPYDTVIFDSASAYNTGTKIYTVPATGIYNIVRNDFLFGGTAASTLFVGRISVNGAAAPAIRTNDINPGSLGLATNAEFILSTSYMLSLTAGDTLELYLIVRGGATNDVGVGGGAVSATFSGFRVG